MSTTKTSRRLLVVDDDPRITRMLVRVAKKLGFETSAVSTAADFDHAYDQALPDIILLDLNMPDVDGVELLRRLAKWGCTSAIFVISGVNSRILDTTALLGTTLGLNMSGVLPKPIDIEALRAALVGLQTDPVTPSQKAPRDAPIDESGLRRAIEGDELEVAYQLQIELKSGKPCGAEVLARWRHPEFGLIPPAQFIPLAEHTGLIMPLTDRVVEIALTDWSCWTDITRDLRLAINLSATLLDDLKLPDRLAEVLARHRFDPSRIVLEVTETAAMEDPTKSMDILSRLGVKGFGLSIDDFGTGSSSLTQLHRLPYEEVKVDRSFVAQATTNREAAAIVRSTIDLGHDMGMRVVAEGIEDQETLDWLANRGCDIGQGYYLGKPMSREMFLQCLSQDRSAADGGPGTS